MTKLKKHWRWICLVLLLAFTILVFSFSFDSAAESTEKSESITQILQSVCDFLKLDIDVVENTIRKVAHFIEFALLGVLALLTSRAFGYGACPALLYSLIVATLDETIQIYSPERFSSTRDVLLDFVGALFGTLLLFLLTNIPKKKK